MKNKKAMSLAIVLLVLATLILSGFALLTFNARENDISETIQITKFLRRIYSEEVKINFYVENILRGMEVKGLSKDEFKNKFTTELIDYRTAEWEPKPLNFNNQGLTEEDEKLMRGEISLEELLNENIIDKDSITWDFIINNDLEVSEEKIVMPLTISIRGYGLNKKGEDIANATYIYDKTFEKIIKKESIPKEESTS